MADMVFLKGVAVRGAACIALQLAFVACVAASDWIVPYRISNDEISAPLSSHPGDAVRGREVFVGRDGNCLLCHSVPETGTRFMGNLGPQLSGIGARLNAGQLRLRIVDSQRLNVNTIMPPYYRTEGLESVAAAWQGRPALTAQQIEDVIAYLQTLR